jgi:hypothetical protein
VSSRGARSNGTATAGAAATLPDFCRNTVHFLCFVVAVGHSGSARSPPVARHFSGRAFSNSDAGVWREREQAVCRTDPPSYTQCESHASATDLPRYIRADLAEPRAAVCKVSAARSFSLLREVIGNEGTRRIAGDGCQPALTTDVSSRSAGLGGSGGNTSFGGRATSGAPLRNSRKSARQSCAARKFRNRL